MDREEKLKATMQELNRRNTETVEKKLIEYDKLFREQQIRIEGFNNILSDFSNRLNSLETQINLMRMNLIGRGPSVK